MKGWVDSLPSKALTLFWVVLLAACGGQKEENASASGRYLATAGEEPAVSDDDSIVKYPPGSSLGCTEVRAPASTMQVTTYLHCNGVVVDKTRRGHTWVVGQRYPVSSHAVLDAVERYFLYKNFPDFPTTLLDGSTQAKQVQTIDYRNKHWRNFNGVPTRTWEFIVSTDLNATLMSDYGVLDPVRMYMKHEELATQIYQSARPSLNLVPYLDRIIFVTKDVLYDAPVAGSWDAGWHVLNDNAYSYWANDEFRGIDGIKRKHIIPQDVDSRWALGNSWHTMFNQYNFQSKPSVDCRKTDPSVCFIDTALLHELVHHNPVGDLYSDDPTYAAGVVLPLSVGKNIVYKPFNMHFARNDMMSQYYGDSFTAYHYATLYSWLKYPEQKRNSQHFYPEQFTVDSASDFPSTLTISIPNFGALGFTRCASHRTPIGDPSYAEPTPGSPFYTYRYASSKVQSVSVTNGTCTLTLSASDQLANAPGLWLMLGKPTGALVPVYLPVSLFRVAGYEKAYRLQSAAAVSQPARITLKLLPRINTLLDKYNQLVASTTAARVPNGNLKLKALFIRPDEVPTLDAGGQHYVELETPLDSYGNQYYMGFVEN